MTKPSNKVLKRIFDTASPSYESITSSYAKKRRFTILQSWAKGDCLEIGAATGELALQLQEKHKLIATDNSPKMVLQMKKKGVKFAFVCDGERLPFGSALFDTVIASEVIYYLDHPKRFIHEAQRVLKEGGRLLITSATSTSSFYSRLRRVLRMLGFPAYFDDGVSELPSEKKLRVLLQEGNFRITQTKRIIIVPFALLHMINVFFEQTFLETFCCFVVIKAVKQ